MRVKISALEINLEQMNTVANSKYSLSAEEYETLSQKALCADEYFAKLDSLNKELESYQSEVVQLQNTVAELESAASDRYNADMATMNQNLVDLRAENEQINAYCTELNTKYLEMEYNSTISLQQSQEEFDELARLYDAATKELDSIKNKQGTLSTQFIEHQKGQINFGTLVSTLEAEILVLKAETEHLRKQASESFEQSRQIMKLESELSESRNLIYDLENQVKVSKSDLQAARQIENRCFTLENELNQLVQDRERQNHDFEESIYQERQRAKQMLEYRIKEVRINYDMTLEEMNHRHLQLEQILDETENTLSMERETFHRREQSLLEELSFTQGRNSRNSRFPYPHRDVELENERLELIAELQQTQKENRTLRRELDGHLNRFAKEKFELMQTIEEYKDSSQGILHSEAGTMIQRLQNQKNEIEFQLSKKEESLKELENMLRKSKNGTTPNAEISDLEKQREALEKILFIREEELKEAQQKISHLMVNFEEHNAKDELYFANRSMEKQLQILKSPSRSTIEQVRLDLSESVAYIDEISALLYKFFRSILGQKSLLRRQDAPVDIQKYLPN